MQLANLPTLDQVESEISKHSHIDFIKRHWMRKDKFLVGKHTKAIGKRLDKAIKDFRNGLSTFLVIKVPFRHGKSDLVSRYLPARFLGMFPDQEVLLTTYAASLSNDLSKDCRKILKSETFQKTFSKVRLSKTSASVESWGIEGNSGKFNAAGLLGGMTGKGYALGILDDYLKNREDAESETIRNKGWDEFTNSFLTRRAPVSITIVMATPWHTDDIIGRIEQKINDKPDFPKFEIVSFPAKSEKYSTGFLFPERFTEDWYKGQFSALGSYGASALLQCSPITRGGRIIKVNDIQYYDGEPPKSLQFIRAWDLALSAKERDKDDPDYSVGIKLAVWREKKFNNFYLDHLYIDDLIRGRWGTADRDRIILETAVKEEIPIFAEYTGLFKDSYAHLSDVLNGHRTIGKVTPSKDLMIRSAAIEPIFEAGNVYMRRADWNQPFLAELAAFPGDKHDDQLAALVTGYEATKKSVNRNYFFKGAM
jgi:predicted phage terminase large subunit-like protein